MSLSDLDVDAAEIAEVFSRSVADSGDWSAELLLHNPKNAVTAGVFRIRAGEDSAILKVLSGDKQANNQAWASSDTELCCFSLAFESWAGAERSSDRVEEARALSAS